MSEEKKIILRMLKEGKISEDEALTLLDSIKENNKRDSKKTDFNFDFNNIETSNFVDKIVQAANKISKKSAEVINNIDLEDFSLKFNSNLDQKNKVEKTVAENIEAIENPNLEIRNRNGKVTVSSWDNQEIEAKADVTFDDRYVSADYDFVTLKITDNNIKIEPNFENVAQKGFSLDLFVKLPKKLYEKVNIDSTNTKIELNDIEAGDIDLESVNGKISLKNVTAKKANVHTTNGKIEAKEIKGGFINLHTTNGKIEARDLATEELKAKSNNGTLDISNIKNEMKLLSASTNNGRVNISLKDITKPVKAKVQNHIKQMDFSNFSDTMFSNFITEGGAIIAYSDNYKEDEDKLEIEASTYNGSIYIN